MFSHKIVGIALVASAALAVSGCGGRAQLGGAPGLRVLPGKELPAPERMDSAANSAPYYVGPFDRLVIDVFGIEELSNREVQVDASGRISFPLVGIVEVLGKTPGEIESEMVQRLRVAHVRNPEVTINLKETISRTVTIEGEVRQPGVFPVVGRLTLLSAIAKAQSTTEYSKLEDVVVYRTVSGQRYAALYDLKAIRHGVYGDPEIFAGDLVMVGDDRSRRLFKDVLSAVPALLSPILILLR
jgi:polysaccharide export outer membrane protein